MIKIHMLPVRYGDSLVVEIDEPAPDPSQTTLLIDCSFNYKTDILPLLETLAESGRSIDRFIITHFDDDHIRSAAKLISDNGQASSPQVIPIRQVWLNAYRHLQFDKRPAEKPSEEQQKLLKTFIAVNSPAGEATGEISAKQATTLGKELLKYGYSWNEDFDGQAIFVEGKAFVEINPKTRLILLSPKKEQLVKLEKFFERALNKMDITLSDTDLIDDAFELFAIKEDQETVAAYLGNVSAPAKIDRKALEYLYEHAEYVPDTAEGNGSSIAFILEADGKRVLFLADAHAETIIGQLEILYPDKTKYPIFFNAVKVAHHGSICNNARALFDMIDSPNFLISTNGGHPSHDHPDAETLAFIVCRELSNGIKKRNVIFNYMPQHLKGFFNEQLMEELNYQALVATEIELK